MKLLTKTTLNFLSVTLFIFLFGIVAFYFLLRNQVDKNINFELEKRKTSIIKQINTQNSENKIPPNPNERILIDVINGDNLLSEFSYSDTLIFDEILNRYVPFRKLGFTADYNNQKIYIQIFKSLEESDLLIVRIFLILTVLVIVLIVSLLLMNRITLRQSWKIFYDTVKKISNYKVDTHKHFSLKSSDITEFNDLNRVIESMTNRINADYLNLKEYTEDASHEIQNPLAIINSKLELLMQSGELSEKLYKAVFDAYEASNRLSRLNKSLILLSKIENRQFADSEQINLNGLIQKQIELLEDIIETKGLKIETKIDNSYSLEMNPYLAEILFINLIKNAIRHNIPGGVIRIEQESNNIKVSNSGNNLQIDPKDLFKRFQKSSNSPDSLGLGLSIVKKICDVYNYSINYEFDQMHTFTIKVV